MRSRGKYILCHFSILVNSGVNIFCIFVHKQFTTDYNCLEINKNKISLMKKQHWIKYRIFVEYVLFALEWIYLLSAIFNIIQNGFGPVSVLTTLVLLGFVFIFGRLTNEFDRFIHTVHIDDVQGNRRYRRKVYRNVLKELKRK
jgi:hypothetical protein